MTWDGSPVQVRPVNRQLWQKFVHIAQPYFYPLVRGGGWITLLLIVLLLVWVFALLFLCVAAITFAGHHLTKRATTSFTLVGISADFTLLAPHRPSLADGA